MYARKVRLSELEFNDLMSEVYQDNSITRIPLRSFTRYYDTKLKDMYDHNFFYIEGDITVDIYDVLLDIKEYFKEDYMKIESPTRQPLMLLEHFEESKTDTMFKRDYLNFNVPEKLPLRFVSVREVPETINDIVRMEVKYYGELYGEDFCVNRCARYLENILFDEDSGLDFWVAYLGDEAVGYCYSFYNGDVVGVDSLLVEENYRHQYVASNLLKHIGKTYNCPMYLHADADESVKEMYQKLGFRKLYQTYEYLKTFWK